MAGAHERGKAQASLAVRLLWFAALWLAGITAVGLLALAVRAALRL